MKTFIISESKNGALIPLPELIDRLRLNEVVTWRFCDIKMGHGTPFGMTVEDFEAASRAGPNGFEVTEGDFQAFLATKFQIIDGEIEALSGKPPYRRVMRLNCEDASQWEIRTDVPELISVLEQCMT